MERPRAPTRSTSAVSSLSDRESVASVKGKRKRRRGSRRSTRMSRTTVVRGPVEGLTKLHLTPIDQELLQVKVGENLTSDMPWARFKISELREDVEKREEDSPFFKIIHVLSRLRDVYIGYDPDRESDMEYLITTARWSSAAVGRLLVRLEERQRQRIVDSIWRQVRGWRSLGSENDISPQVLEMARAPLRQEALVRLEPGDAPTFDDVGPDAQRGGQVLLSNTGMYQQRYKNVSRRCVSHGVQARPEAHERHAQTEISFPINMGVQYEYAVDTDTPLEEGPLTKSLAQFLKNTAPRFEELLRVNTGIDVFFDDFHALIRNKKDTRTPAVVVYKELESFIHVESSKGSVITALSWHPCLTGMAACAYVRDPRLLPKKYPRRIGNSQGPTLTDPVLRDVHGPNGVLVWCLTDSFKPKLCLEAPRPVHSLAFCPYDETLLVGGMENGQIVIWDLKDRVEQAEEKERLTPAQEGYRAAMLGHLKWMKVTRSKARVQATAVSSVEFSHRKCVRAVRWLSPYWPMNPRGHYAPHPRHPPGSAANPPGKDKWGLQLLTAAEDGAVNVWDLRVEQAAKAGSYQPRKKWKKRQRLPGLDKSEFQGLHRLIRPHFRIEVEEPYDADDQLLNEDPDRAPVMVPLTALAARRCVVNYQPDDVEEVFEELMEDATAPPPFVEGLMDEVDSAIDGGGEGAEGGELTTEGEDSDEGSRKPSPKAGSRHSMSARRASRPKGSPVKKEEARRSMPKGLGDKDTDKLKQQAKWEEEDARAEAALKEEAAAAKGDDDVPVERQRRHFSVFPELVDRRPENEVDLGTMDGRVMRIRWQGLDTNMMEVVNRKRADMAGVGRNVHDGPVAIVQRSPFAPELLLSVGGKVWAIWRDDARRSPLLWRRAPENVYAAGWSAHRPSVIVLVRADGVLEAWDLAVFSEKPAFTQMLGDKNFAAMAYPELPVEDKMVGMGDSNGALRIYFVPEEHIMSLEVDEDEEIELLRRIMDKERQRQKRARAWERKWRKKAPARHEEEEEEEAASEGPVTRPPASSQESTTISAECVEWDVEHEALRMGTMMLAQEIANEERWRRGEELHMRRTLLRLLQWDKDAIIKAGRPLVQRRRQQAAKRRKLAEYLSKKYALFEKTVAELFPELTAGDDRDQEEEEEGRKKEGPMDGGRRYLEEFGALKETFIRDYQKAERKALASVRRGSYAIPFDWILLQHEAVLRRTLLDPELREALKRQAQRPPPTDQKTYWKLVRRGEPVYHLLDNITGEIAEGKYKSMLPRPRGASMAGSLLMSALGEELSGGDASRDSRGSATKVAGAAVKTAVGKAEDKTQEGDTTESARQSKMASESEEKPMGSETKKSITTEGEQKKASVTEKKSIGGEARKSVGGEARKSVGGEARKSVGGEPKKSVTEEPKKSVTEEPKKSVTEEPKKSVTGEPKKSVTEEPKKSITGEPKKSVAEEPKKSVTGEPKKSVTEEPKKSVAEEPKKSIAGEPKKSVGGESKKSVAGAEDAPEGKGEPKKSTTGAQEADAP